MLIFDRIEFGGTKRVMTDEGYLKVPANLARVGTYQYKAGEIGMPDRDPESNVTVYRPPNEVFNQDSMSSFSMKPVTNGHPPELVDISNIKKYQVGHSGGKIERNGDFVTSDLLITDAAMIKLIQNGKCEVSNGYVADFDFTAGSTEYGDQYDAIMTNIRGNHIAVVDQARGGRGCRLSDEQKHGDPSMKKIMFDGIEIEVTEQGEQAIAKLRKKVEDADKATAAAESKIDTVTAEKDAVIAQKDKDITDAESKVVDGKELDALIETRTKIVTDAKSLKEDVVIDGKSNDEIVESVVVELCDGVSFDGKSDDYKKTYCAARFDALLVAKDSAGDGSEKIVIDENGMKKEDKDEGEEARKTFTKKSEDAYKMEAK